VGWLGGTGGSILFNELLMVLEWLAAAVVAVAAEL